MNGSRAEALPSRPLRIIAIAFYASIACALVLVAAYFLPVPTLLVYVAIVGVVSAALIVGGATVAESRTTGQSLPRSFARGIWNAIRWAADFIP